MSDDAQFPEWPKLPPGDPIEQQYIDSDVDLGFASPDTVQALAHHAESRALNAGPNRAVELSGEVQNGGWAAYTEAVYSSKFMYMPPRRVASEVCTILRDFPPSHPDFKQNDPAALYAQVAQATATALAQVSPASEKFYAVAVDEIGFDPSFGERLLRRGEGADSPDLPLIHRLVKNACSAASFRANSAKAGIIPLALLAERLSGGEHAAALQDMWHTVSVQFADQKSLKEGIAVLENLEADSMLRDIFERKLQKKIEYDEMRTEIDWAIQKIANNMDIDNYLALLAVAADCYSVDPTLALYATVKGAAQVVMASQNFWPTHFDGVEQWLESIKPAKRGVGERAYDALAHWFEVLGQENAHGGRRDSGDVQSELATFVSANCMPFFEKMMKSEAEEATFVRWLQILKTCKQSVRLETGEAL
jgi:hypothetical protein